MIKRFDISAMDEKLQFDVKLQIALRNTALQIMKFYSDTERFRNYVSDREKKLKTILDSGEDLEIFNGDTKLFP
ncbi:MAG: hypothetical protein M1476_07425 [Candidatus Thermoplasmatota archaeon]|nr:hypothetical protein [Candidatus Thermoplasmatota archaeon]